MKKTPIWIWAIIITIGFLLVKNSGMMSLLTESEELKQLDWGGTGYPNPIYGSSNLSMTDEMIRVYNYCKGPKSCTVTRMVYLAPHIFGEDSDVEVDANYTYSGWRSSTNKAGPASGKLGVGVCDATSVKYVLSENAYTYGNFNGIISGEITSTYVGGNQSVIKLLGIVGTVNKEINVTNATIKNLKPCIYVTTSAGGSEYWGSYGVAKGILEIHDINVIVATANQTTSLVNISVTAPAQTTVEVIKENVVTQEIIEKNPMTDILANLLVLLFIITMLALFFVLRAGMKGGGFSWKRVKYFFKVNKEGTIAGSIIGTLLIIFYYMGWTGFMKPLFPFNTFTNIVMYISAGALIGAMLDSIIKPLK